MNAEQTQPKELTIADAKPCVKGDCLLAVTQAIFGGGSYVYCLKCRKSAGIQKTEGGAVAEWNRWLEIGNGRI